jgi:hypothetical protein
MTTDLSTPHLLELIHQYYPANLRGADVGYVKSEQYQRLLRARREALENSGPWKRLFSKLTEALPNCRIEALCRQGGGTGAFGAGRTAPAP